MYFSDELGLIKLMNQGADVIQVFRKPRNSAMPTTLPSPQLIRQSADAGALVRQRRKAQQLRIDDAAALLGVLVDLLSRLDKLLTVLDGLGLALVLLPKESPQLHALASASASGQSAGK